MNTVLNIVMLVSYVAVCMMSLKKCSDVVVNQFINLITILVLTIEIRMYK